MTRLLPALFLALTPAAWAETPGILATFHTDNGSLPPEYAWAIDVTILEDGALTMALCKGYATEPPGCETHTGQVSDDALAAIRQAAVDSGLLTDPAEEHPDPPDGGDGTSGSVTLDGETILLPRYPAPGQVERVVRVLLTIGEAIPPDLVALVPED